MPAPFQSLLAHYRLWVAALALVPAILHAQERRPVAEFTVGREGRPLLLPVRMGNQEFRMLVDTGATLTGFDVTLRKELGPSLGSEALSTPTGPILADTFRPPEATVGNLPLEGPRKVFCHDFRTFREATGEPIFGVIGIDFLNRWIVQIDFDRGYLRLFRPDTEPAAAWGEQTELIRDPQYRPCVIGRAGDSLEVAWLIDTGANNNSVRPELFDRLVKTRQLQLGARYASVAAGGRLNGAAGRLSVLDIEGFHHEQLRCERARPSSLGLNYLSRYTLTLDLPRQRAWFKPGQHFQRPEAPATSGLVLKRVDRQTLVAAVKPQSAALRAGLQADDELLTVNGLPVEKLDFFELRRLLTSQVGRRIPVEIRRDGHQIAIELKLESIDRVPDEPEQKVSSVDATSVRGTTRTRGTAPARS
ncbi:MAG TPA: aspartyl protease family protein [Planctomycetaceae bacterium]|nr:aspartyl protease family protein [Planctomycetaceae bacterium]